MTNNQYVSLKDAITVFSMVCEYPTEYRIIDGELIEMSALVQHPVTLCKVDEIESFEVHSDSIVINMLNADKIHLFKKYAEM